MSLPENVTSLLGNTSADSEMQALAAKQRMRERLKGVLDQVLERAEDVRERPSLIGYNVSVEVTEIIEMFRAGQ